MFYLICLFIAGLNAIEALLILFYRDYNGFCEFCILLFIIINFFVLLTLMIDNCIRKRNFV